MNFNEVWIVNILKRLIGILNRTLFLKSERISFDFLDGKHFEAMLVKNLENLTFSSFANNILDFIIDKFSKRTGNFLVFFKLFEFKLDFFLRNTASSIILVI
jgi:hypothetical protein